MSGAPDTNLLYNLLADYTPLSQLVGQLAGHWLCRDVGLWQDQRPTSCTTCWALVLPEPNKFVGDVAQQVGQLVRIVEFGHNPTSTYNVFYTDKNRREDFLVTCHF